MKGVKSYINLITGLCVFVAFLLLNLVSVEFAPQDFLTIVLNSGLMMACWIMIRNAFAEQGLISAQKDPEVKATKKEHLITSNEISTFKADFNIWCERKNAERLKQKRIAILSGSSLVYEDYFDKSGNFIAEKEVPKQEITDNEKLNKLNQKRYKKDCRLLNKARFAFVPPYEPEDITAREDISSKKRLFGVSIKHWKNIKIISSIIMSLVISIMLSFVKTQGKVLSQDAIMILVFELLIMAGSAFAFYFSASNFVCGDWREGLIQKTRIMEEFYRNVVGTITYENDIQRPDGTVVVGKKIFTKNKDYIPLVEIGNERKNEEQVQSIMELAEKKCFKQTNDIVGDNSRANLLESCDNNSTFSLDCQSVVLDSDKCNNVVLGGTIYTSSAASDRLGTCAEENIRVDQKEKEQEE